MAADTTIVPQAAASLPPSPAGNGPERARAETGPSHTPETFGANSLILVAEDDSASRDFVEFFLSGAGFKVMLAQDGKEVFDLLGQATPDLFLLDCHMPIMDGFEVCRRLKTDPALADLPIVFLTGLSQPQDKKRGFDLGGVDYVIKPIEPIELLARIRNHLELAARRKTLRQQADSLAKVVAGDRLRFNEVHKGQASLLTQPSTFPELNLAVRYKAAHVAGGDFYELMRLTDTGDYGILMTDVSGHDLSVPYVTGALKALAVTFLKDALTPQETMLMLNASLLSFLQPGYYVTGCYLKYSREQMQIDLINAAHPPVLHQTVDGATQFIDLTGDVLGMIEIPQFHTHRLPVGRGERLFVYTDGLIESYVDEDKRWGRPLWGMHRLAEEVASRRSRPLQETVDSVVDELLAECGGAAHDDIVLFGIEF